MGVASVLEGSVQRAGERLRISAQLVKASTGTNLWSRDVRPQRRRHLRRAGRSRARGRDGAQGTTARRVRRVSRASEPTRDREAYDLYLQGRFFWNRRAVPDLDKAIGFFEQAIARDSAFALAWAGLADDYIALAFYSSASSPATLAKVARRRRACTGAQPGARRGAGGARVFAHGAGLEISPLPTARSGERSRLSPGYATAHKWYSDLFEITGRPDEALRELMRARELDPLAPIIMANIGSSYAWMGKDDEAVNWLEKALALDPDLPLALQNAAVIYFKRGDSTRFFAAHERLDSSSTRAGAPAVELRRAWASGGRDAVLRAQLASPRAKDLPFERARWRAQLGDIDGAFRELDTAFAERTIWIIYVSDFADLAPIRGDPRYAALLKRLGLPDVRSAK